MTADATAARLIEVGEIVAGLHRLRFAAREVAARCRPGQFVTLLEPSEPALLRPALPIAGFDRIAGTLDLIVAAADVARTGHPALMALLRLRVDDPVRLSPPLGRGFEIDPRSRHLLLVADERGMPRVSAILDEAVATGRQVTLLTGVDEVGSVWPASQLPESVEYVVATADGSLGHHGPVTELVPDFEAWADQCLAAGDSAMLATLAHLAGGRDARMGVARLGRKRRRTRTPSRDVARRRSWLQVAVGMEVACALGVCLGCAVEAEAGAVRACREGPVLAGGELRTASAR